MWSMDDVPTWMRPRSFFASPPAAGNSRHPVQHEVDLGDGARCPDVARAPAHGRPDRDRIHQARQQLLRVEARHDHRGRRSPRPMRARRRSPRRRRWSPRRPSRSCGSRRLQPARPHRAPPTARTGRPSRTRSRPRHHRRCRRRLRAGPTCCPPTTGPWRCSGRRARRRSRRIASLSNDSPTKSATAMASTRRIMRPSCLPRPRNARPSRRPSRASPKPGPLMSGGASSPRSDRNRESDRTRRSYSTNDVASSSENARSDSTLLARSAYSVTARPSGCGAKTRTSGATSESPWEARSSSRTTDGRSRPTVWARVGNADAAELLGDRGAADDRLVPRARGREDPPGPCRRPP